MKTKNTFRVFLMAAFVLGTMAMNAQTKIYVHKTGGMDKVYNLADVDSISFNPLYVGVTGVTLDKSALSLIAGQTGTLTATVAPTNATDKSVTWVSDNPSAATVSASGGVTAVAEGTANITVTTTNGNFKATCAVTVTAASTGANLLANPGFFEPDDATATLQGWEVMTMDEVLDDVDDVLDANPAIKDAGKTGNATTAVNRSVDGFWTTNFVNPETLGVNFNLTPHNGQAARLFPAGNNGIYQLVNVTPEKTYAFSAYILFHRQNSNNQTILNQFMRIKTGDGATTLTKVLLADAGGIVKEGEWMYITGTVAIPAGVTQVRLQFSQLDFNLPNITGSRSAGTVIDDCDFHEVE